MCVFLWFFFLVLVFPSPVDCGELGLRIGIDQARSFNSSGPSIHILDRLCYPCYLLPPVSVPTPVNINSRFFY